MGKKNEKIVQTAGRNQLGEFAPMFAHLNDDVLFGEVWNEDALPTKTKCIITVVALMSSGITDSSLLYHLQNAKNNGVSKKEMSSASPCRSGARTIRQRAKRLMRRARCSR